MSESGNGERIYDPFPSPQRNERSLYHIINDVVRINISNHGEKEIDHRFSQLCYLRIFGVNEKALLSDGQSV